MRRVALAVTLALAGCGADAPRARFDADVAPVLQRRCAAAGCHGVPPGASSARRFRFPTDARGYLADGAARDAAYAAARRFVNTTEGPELSSLLRKGLPPDLGGLPHGGGSPFRDRRDPGFVAVRDWIATERGGGEDGDPAALSEGERHFAEHVQPLLAEGQCMLAPCHGAIAAVPLRFDPGLDGRFGVAATRHNYAQAVVHLALGGFAERSRLARKAVRDPATFLPHRGGNGLSAFPTAMSDALPRAVVAWAQTERRLRARGAPERALDGVVFVGGPARAARVTEHAPFVPGTDLYLLAPPSPGGAVRNLTAALHDAPVEVRNPAVDDAGARVAFALRRRADEGAALWELALATGAARQVTAPPPGAHDLWPAYGPDGRLWFVSTRAGTLAEHADGPDTDLYVVERDGRVTRRSFTPSPELATTFFRVGSEATGQVAFTAIRRLGDDWKGVVYRFPPDLHNEYHQHFGITPGDDTLFHLRESPEGLYAGVLLDRDAVWSAGALVLIDRNLGIEVPRRASATVPGYVHPVSYLGPYGAHGDAVLDPTASRPVRRDVSDGAYRDPHPLPDGRLAVAWAPGPVALRDRAAPPDFGLWALTVAHDPATGEARVTHRERLVDLPGASETEPVPVFRDVPGVVWGDPPGGATGRLLHGGIPMLENVFRQVGPEGPRTLRDDIRAVRVLGWLPRVHDPAAGAPSASLHPEQRATGATPHGPARVLAEVPVEGDGTLHLELDAGTAFRLQLLDARGMAVGAQHNRWFDVGPGQALRQGIQPGAYDVRCAACHGARDGRPEGAFGPVDVTARASRSLARFEDDDPDRPRPPVRVAFQTALAAEWTTVVRPALARSCAADGCHGERAPAAGLALAARPTARYDAAYEALVARGEGSRGGFRYVDVTGASARGSYVVERLLGEELDAPRAVAGAPPHRGAPPLDDAAVRALVRWIEAGATYCAEACP